MDWAEFEQQRISGFATARRGYDKDEVDRFLDAVAGWLQTDAAEELGDREIERKLEAAGQSTARILLIAEQEAQELRRKTDEECADLRANAEAAAQESAARTLEIAEQQAEELRRQTEEECADLTETADTIANDTCSRAEKYATEIRAKADEDAKQMIDEARVRARAVLLEETERKRAEVDAIVDELERRRSAAVEKVERLRADLLSAISKDSPRAQSTERDGGSGQRRHAPAYGSSNHANA
jgi:cell division septum initiation protein DivIVA